MTIHKRTLDGAVQKGGSPMRSDALVASSCSCARVSCGAENPNLAFAGHLTPLSGTERCFGIAYRDFQEKQQRNQQHILHISHSRI